MAGKRREKISLEAEIAVFQGLVASKFHTLADALNPDPGAGALALVFGGQDPSEFSPSARFTNSN